MGQRHAKQSEGCPNRGPCSLTSSTETSSRARTGIRAPERKRFPLSRHMPSLQCKALYQCASCPQKCRLGDGEGIVQD